MHQKPKPKPKKKEPTQTKLLFQSAPIKEQPIVEQVDPQPATPAVEDPVPVEGTSVTNKRPHLPYKFAQAPPPVPVEPQSEGDEASSPHDEPLVVENESAALYLDLDKEDLAPTPAPVEDIIDWSKLEGQANPLVQPVGEFKITLDYLPFLAAREDGEKEPLSGPIHRKLLANYLESREPHSEPEEPVQLSDSEEIVRVDIPGELPPATKDDRDHKKEMCTSCAKTGLVMDNAAFLHICGGIAYCLACYAVEVGDDTLLQSSRREWGGLGKDISNMQVSGPKGSLKSFYSHCDPLQTPGHLKNVQIYGEKFKNKKKRRLAACFEKSKQLNAEEVATVVEFIYTTMYENVSLRKVRSFLDAALKTGAKVGNHWRSESSHRRVAKQLSRLVKKSMQYFIIEKVQAFGINLDESTSVSKKKCLIISMRYCVSRRLGSLFLKLAEVDGKATAENLVSLLEKSLESLGVSRKILRERLVSLTTDGASVMTGDSNGVVTRLNELYGGKKLILVHCQAHALELAFNDARDLQRGFDFFLEAVKALGSNYRNSSTLHTELEAVAKRINVQLRAFLRFHEVRWAASLYRLVFNLLFCLPAIFVHMREHISKLPKNPARKKMDDLFTVIGCYEFLEVLLFIMECVGVMAQASVHLQKADLTLAGAHVVVKDLHAYLEDMQKREQVMWDTKGNRKAESKPLEVGPSQVRVTWFDTSDVITLRDELRNSYSFGGVQLQRNKAFKGIHFPDFLTKFAASVKHRILDQNKVLVSHLSVLTLENIQNAAANNYGQASVDALSESTKLVECPVQLKHALRTFVIAKNRAKNNKVNPPPDLSEKKYLPLVRFLERSMVPAASSADVERYFSHMNLIHTDERSRYLTETVDDVMFLRENGPAPHVFDSVAASRQLLEAMGDIREQKEEEPTLSDWQKAQFDFLLESQGSLVIGSKTSAVRR